MGAAFGVAFAVLTVADFSLGFQLTYIGVLSLLAATGRDAATRAERDQAVKKYRLTVPPRSSRWRMRRLMRWACWFLLYVGLLGTACLAGGLLAELFT